MGQTINKERGFMCVCLCSSVDIYDELQALHAGDVRPPEGKSAAPEGPDGEIRGRRGSLIRMHDMMHGPP